MSAATSCYQLQAQLSKPSYPRLLEETTVETAESDDVMISDEDWVPPAEFADMLTTVTELLNHSANLKRLKQFLRYFCHPHTLKCYIDIRLYEHCNTPGEIIEVLHPQYINFMHTQFLRQIVNKFGDEQSKTLLKQYEDKFPHKKPLKRIGDPLSDEEVESFTGTKRMKVVYSGATADTSTMEDVERVRQLITRNTGIDESVIPFASQKQCNSVLFMFLIPETVVSAFSDLDEDNWRDLTDNGILRIEVDGLVIDLQSLQAGTMTDTSQAETTDEVLQTEAEPGILQAEPKNITFQLETETNTFQEETMGDTLQAETKHDTSQTETRSDSLLEARTKIYTSQAETKTDTSTYTTSGMKRIPLSHDSLKGIRYNLEFQQLIFEIGTSLAVEADELKNFLQSFSHILYPEARYVDPSLLINAESVHQIFTALQPQVLNFLNWGVVWKTIGAFDITVESALHSYASRFPPHTKLSTLPDPLSEEEVSELKKIQKLRITCVSGSRNEWTLGDVQAVREAVEKATGIDQDFIIYAYWEGGFSTQQFTFLIPKSISGIFGELCEEDLEILAGKGVQRLEVDYDTIADNIQELYKEPSPRVRAENRMKNKNFGLENFIPEDGAERMSEKEFSYLNDLITSTPASKLQETCSNDFLRNFAKTMGDWKDLAPYLGINEWDLKKLAETYPEDEDKQKCRALVCWKEINVNSATYERLVECLLRHGHTDDAKQLLLHFQGQQQWFVSHL